MVSWESRACHSRYGLHQDGGRAPVVRGVLCLGGRQQDPRGASWGEGQLQVWCLPGASFPLCSLGPFWNWRTACSHQGGGGPMQSAPFVQPGRARQIGHGLSSRGATSWPFTAALAQCRDAAFGHRAPSFGGIWFSWRPSVLTGTAGHLIQRCASWRHPESSNMLLRPWRGRGSKLVHILHFFQRRFLQRYQTCWRILISHRHRFSCGWKRANQSRDFWIENGGRDDQSSCGATEAHFWPISMEYQFDRPQRAAFASSWKHIVSQKLCHVKVKVCTDRFLKMHGTSLQLHIFLIELEGSGLVAAVFPSGTQGAPIQPSEEPVPAGDANTALLSMADESTRAAGGARCPSDSCAPSMDSPGASSDLDRADQGGSGFPLRQPWRGCPSWTWPTWRHVAKRRGSPFRRSQRGAWWSSSWGRKVQPAGEQVVPFGKYKSWMYKEIPEAYLHWAIKETNANSNSSPDLVKLANWAKEDLEKRATQARVAGAVPMAEDPEVRAKHPPPPVSSAGSSASWSLMSAGGYTTQRGRGTPFPKRDAATMDAARMAEMDMELPEEAQAEMLRLETEMAVIRQKYNKAKDYSQWPVPKSMWLTTSNFRWIRRWSGMARGRRTTCLCTRRPSGLASLGMTWKSGIARQSMTSLWMSMRWRDLRGPGGDLGGLNRRALVRTSRPDRRRERESRGARSTSSTKRKLQHMGQQLCQVLITCLLLPLGTSLMRSLPSPCRTCGLASQQAHTMIQPVKPDAWRSLRVRQRYPKPWLGAIMEFCPRDLRYGDDLYDPGVRQEVYREIREERPDLVWIGMPCTRRCAFSRLNYTKQGKAANATQGEGLS